VLKENGSRDHAVCPFMDKTPILAVENQKEDAMSQQEQRPLRGTEAEIYERYLVPAIFAPWAVMLIEQAALQPGERVLDVASGTGVVARLAAQQVGSTGQIIGLDNDAERLRVARSLPPLPGVSLVWQEGSALAIPFADASFDALLCQQVCSFSRIARLPSVRCTGCWCLGDECSSASGGLLNDALATLRW
jgi:SAM-dependent methyltransferase